MVVLVGVVLVRGFSGGDGGSGGGSVVGGGAASCSGNCDDVGS